MARKRDDLVLIGEAFGGLDGPVKTIRKASPRRCTTSPSPIK